MVYGRRQIVNFLILVWLLKRFLYQPILHAIDAREQRIAASLADAAAKEVEARTERDTFQRKNEAFDQQRAALLSQATDAARDERQRLLDEARLAADTLRGKRQEALQREHQRLSNEIAHRTRTEVFAIARQALTDLRRDKSGRTHERGLCGPPASAGRRGQTKPRHLPAGIDPDGARAQRL